MASGSSRGVAGVCLQNRCLSKRKTVFLFNKNHLKTVGLAWGVLFWALKFKGFAVCFSPTTVSRGISRWGDARRALSANSNIFSVRLVHGNFKSRFRLWDRSESR